jgi:hypothetical protein
VEKWLAQDPSRSKYLKDRPKRSKPIEQFYTLKSNNQRNKICNQCKQPIRAYDPVVEYQFKQNGRRLRWYFHPVCSPIIPGKNKLKPVTIQFNENEVTGAVRFYKDKNLVCFVCGKTVAPGEEIFIGYLKETLLSGHLACCTALSIEPVNPVP